MLAIAGGEREAVFKRHRSNEDVQQSKPAAFSRPGRFQMTGTLGRSPGRFKIFEFA